MRKLFLNMPRGARFIFIPLMAAAFLSLISFVVMSLWNAFLPQIIHVEPINFWQAGGIFILCKILFGFGKPGGFRRDRADFKERWAQRFETMTPEERERFKDRVGYRMFCCRDRSHRSDENNAATH